MLKVLSKIIILVLLFVSFVHTSRAQTPPPIKILLVPGHDNVVWGAQYSNLKEAAMNLAIARRLYVILKKDNRFEVYITRNNDTPSGYTKEFADYFENNKQDILAFEQNSKKEMQDNIASGEFIQKENAPHLTVTSDVALRLYGLNKWANEHSIDAMIHIHFNDYPRAHSWTQGVYKGFAIYMPDGQLPNWKESAELAANIFIELKKKYTTSTYEPEKGGLVPDQKLIALGANGTLDASVRSVLIEYGYIYSLGNSVAREEKYNTMAALTAAGIKNYFFPEAIKK